MVMLKKYAKEQDYEICQDAMKYHFNGTNIMEMMFSIFQYGTTLFETFCLLKCNWHTLIEE
jgi:hypothetical protein